MALTDDASPLLTEAEQVSALASAAPTNAPELVSVAASAAPRRHRLTGSKIKLGRHCLWWARPDVELPEGDSSRAALVGTALHQVAEGDDDDQGDDVEHEALEERLRSFASDSTFEAAAMGLTAAERDVLEQLGAAWGAWFSSVLEGNEPGAEVHKELALAIDVDTGVARALPQTGPRDYSAATAREVCCTVDLAVRAAGTETRLVIDYKTGQGPHRTADHIDQLTLGGLAAQRALGWSSVRVAALHVTVDGAEQGIAVDVTRFAASVLLAELRKMLDALPTAEARPGLHCEDYYCPARAVCPATRALLLDAKLDIEPRKRLPITGPVTTNEQAHAVLVGVPLIEAWAKDRIKEARQYADQHGGVRGPDGRLYKGREEQRETARLEVDGADRVLVEALGPLGAEAIETKRTASWKSIETVIRKRISRGEKGLVIKDEREKVREALREAGALKVSKFTKYGWKKEK